jgi:hypothetical protein
MMKKIVSTLILCLMLVGCCTNAPVVPVAVTPPVYQGIPSELTNKPDPMPYINTATASQDDIAVWVAELWKRYVKMDEQRSSVRELDDKFKELYKQYLEQLKKGK